MSKELRNYFKEQKNYKDIVAKVFNNTKSKYYLRINNPGYFNIKEIVALSELIEKQPADILKDIIRLSMPNVSKK